MIYDELYDLKQYIISTVGVNAEIGNPDIDDTQYPFIKILFEEDGLASFMLTKETTIDLPISLKIIVQKGDELKAFKTLDRLILKINQFNDHKGHKLEGSLSPEYDDDTKTYNINVGYNLKLILHDKE
jgi:hypothetical protein